MCDLDETMKTIGNNAFYGCSHLRTVNLGGTQNIANYAFYGCSALNNLTASNVAYVGGYAFYECTALAGFDFSKVTNMGNYAFYYTKIEEAVCPELIQAGSYVFNRCTNLVKVEMPKVMVMAEDMFNGCTSLSEVTLNPEITAIPDYTFNNCPALMEFEIPAGVKIIGRYAFARTGLTTVSIPASCTSIGNNAFGYMPNLVEVKCRAAVPPTLNGTIVPDVDMTQCILYVPAFSRDFYRNAEYWSDFFIMRALNEPVESIYVDRALNINLREEDNANVSNNPEIMLTYGMSEDGYYYSGRRGQLTAEGEGTLSAGVLTVTPAIYANATSSSNIYPTLINNADKMRADNVRHTFRFLSSNTWYMISLPYDVAVSSIEPTPDTYWVIRRYNGETRANKGEEYLNGVSAWENLTENDVMEAYKGYIICATRTNNYDQVTGRYLYPELTFESGNSLTKNNIFATCDVAVPLEEHASEFAHNRSWNLVGNPYPSYYNMNMIQDEFTAPVTVYNGSRYNAFSPVDDKLVLAPYQAFFVQRPLDKEAILFGNAGRQHAYEVSEVSGSEEWKEPASLSMEGRNVFNFCINGEQGERARIVLNPEALASYETDRDASKFFANSGVELYVNRDGIRYAIDERPEADGKAVLGVMSDADATCTISLSGRYSSGWNVILRDNLTGIETDLTAKSYEFVATKGDAADRFSVRFERSNDLSGIDEIAAAFAADEKVAVITSDGVKVYEGAFSGFKAEQGVLYIIRAASRTVKAIY